MRLATSFRVIVLTLCCSVSTRADLPSPRLDVIHPVGASAGTTVELTITGGNDLEGAETLLFDHPGFKSEFVKEKTFRVEVAQDVPAGTYDVRVGGRFGVSNPRLFAVCRGLTEVAEVEPNNTLAQAQTVAVNSAISNHRDGNFLDFFKVSLAAGQRIVVDLQCARLDTEFDPVLFLYSAEGTPLGSNSDHLGRDPLLDFTATKAGDYIIEARDLRYANGAVYRLLIHDRPQVENIFPRAVQVGQTAQLMIFGRNLPGGVPSNWSIGTAAPLQQAVVGYTATGDLFAIGGYRFVEHPNHYSVLPTAATCTLVGDQIAPFGANPQTLVLTDGPTSVEREPNNSKDEPQKLTLPAMLSGRFDQPRDADWYEFETDETGGAYGFDVYSE
ncbi:MAG: PPC domain-containing protein, partial [Planctomycetota bacterium]|nr:PPC domain-containing protein [Planctomycetota bacterium]